MLGAQSSAAVESSRVRWRVHSLPVLPYTLPISMDQPGYRGRSTPDIHVLQLNGRLQQPADHRAGDLLRLGNTSYRRKRLCAGLWRNGLLAGDWQTYDKYGWHSDVPPQDVGGLDGQGEQVDRIWVFPADWRPLESLFRRLGKPARIAILCNPALPGDSPAVMLREMDVPLPARIQTTRTRQTTQFPGRLRRKPARKRVGCSRTWLCPGLGPRLRLQPSPNP